MLEDRRSQEIAAMLSNSCCFSVRKRSVTNGQKMSTDVRNPVKLFAHFVIAISPAAFCRPSLPLCKHISVLASSGAVASRGQDHLGNQVWPNSLSGKVRATDMSMAEDGIVSTSSEFDRLRLSRRDFVKTALALTFASQLSAKKVLASPGPQAREIQLRSGDKMPLVGLGTWESAPGEVGPAVQAALDAGCRHIDCAAAYGNEMEVGEALRSSGIPRGDLFITSKLWNDNRRPTDVREALEKTLRRLGTDYLDLYLIHWPVVWAKDSVMKPDAQASLKETWQTLEQLVDEKKIRNIGISNYNEREIDELLSYCRIPPAMNQIELHPKLPQKALVDFCQRKGIQVTAYSPLGRGSIKNAGLLDSPIVQQVADVHSVSPASVLLRWGIQRGTVVIPKSVTPKRVRQNTQEPWSFELSKEEIEKLDSLADGSRFCTAPWSTFADRTLSDQAQRSLITLLAQGVFSLASVDVTTKPLQLIPRIR